MKILKYKFLSYEINHGTAEEPHIEQVYLDKGVECPNSSFEVSYAAAKAEAYNGEITVEDVADVEAEPTTDEILNAMLGVM